MEPKEAGCQTIDVFNPQRIVEEETVAGECLREPVPSSAPTLSPLLTTPLMILNEEDDEQGLASSYYRTLLAA